MGIFAQGAPVGRRMLLPKLFIPDSAPRQGEEDPASFSKEMEHEIRQLLRRLQYG